MEAQPLDAKNKSEKLKKNLRISEDFSKIGPLKQRLIDTHHHHLRASSTKPLTSGKHGGMHVCVKAKGRYFKHLLCSSHTTGSFHSHFRHTKTGSLQGHSQYFTGPLSITFRFLCKILAQCFEVLQHGGLYSFDSYFTFVFFLLVHVAASKERMMQHKECFGAKSFESVAFERFVR